jgi:hypothetical protein
MVFSFVRYKPVEYGKEPYPEWAELLGWSMSLSSTLPIIFIGIYVFARAKGSTFREKWKSSTAPKTAATDALSFAKVVAEGLPIHGTKEIGEEDGDFSDGVEEPPGAASPHTRDTKVTFSDASEVDPTSVSLVRNPFDRTVDL